MNKEEFAVWVERWNEAAEAFAEQRGLVMTPRLHDAGLAARWATHGMEVIRDSIQESTDLDDREPAWGLLFAALERVFSHAEASVVAMATDSYATAEVIARATVEAAINVRYFLGGNPSERIFDYFSDYVVRERRAVRQWQNLLSGLDDDGRRISIEAIARKNTALDKYEEFLTHIAEQITPPVNGRPAVYHPRPWPNVADRFRAVGEEYTYRTVYGALSSQVHNDAEDLLNRVIIGVMGDAHLKKELVAENRQFALMLTFNAINMALGAARSFAQHMGLSLVDDELALGQRDMQAASYYHATRNEGKGEGTEPTP